MKFDYCRQPQDALNLWVAQNPIPFRTPILEMISGSAWYHRKIEDFPGHGGSVLQGGSRPRLHQTRVIRKKMPNPRGDGSAWYGAGLLIR